MRVIKMSTKERVTITVDTGLLRELDTMAQALGMSRSELIEFLLSESFRLRGEFQKTIDKIAKLQEEVKSKLKKERIRVVK